MLRNFNVVFRFQNFPFMPSFFFFFDSFLSRLNQARFIQQQVELTQTQFFKFHFWVRLLFSSQQQPLHNSSETSLSHHCLCQRLQNEDPQGPLLSLPLSGSVCVCVCELGFQMSRHCHLQTKFGSTRLNPVQNFEFILS